LIDREELVKLVGESVLSTIKEADEEENKLGEPFGDEAPDKKDKKKFEKKPEKKDDDDKDEGKDEDDDKEKDKDEDKDEEKDKEKDKDEDDEWEMKLVDEERKWEFYKDDKLVASIELESEDFDREDFAEALGIEIDEVDEAFKDKKAGKALLGKVKEKEKERKKTSPEGKEKLEEDGEPKTMKPKGKGLDLTKEPSEGLGGPAGKPKLPGVSPEGPRPGGRPAPAGGPPGKFPQEVSKGRMGRLSSNLTEAKKIARKLKAIANNEKTSDNILRKFANFYGVKLQELGFDCPWIKKADDIEEPITEESTTEEAVVTDETVATEETNDSDTKKANYEEAVKIARKMKKIAANKTLSKETIGRLGRHYGKELKKLGYGNPLNSMREDTYTATRKMDNKATAGDKSMISQHAKSRSIDEYGNPLDSEVRKYPAYKNPSDAGAAALKQGHDDPHKAYARRERLADLKERKAKEAELAKLREAKATKDAKTVDVPVDVNAVKEAVAKELLEKLGVCGEIVDLEVQKGIIKEENKTKRIQELIVKDANSINNIYDLIRRFEPDAIQKTGSVSGPMPPMGNTQPTRVVEGLFGKVRGLAR